MGLMLMNIDQWCAVFDQCWRKVSRYSITVRWKCAFLLFHTDRGQICLLRSICTHAWVAGRVYAEQTEPWSPRNSLQTAERGLHGCTDATQQISPTTPSLHSSIMGSQSGRNLPRKGVLRLSALIAAKRVSTKFRAKAVKTVFYFE